MGQLLLLSLQATLLDLLEAEVLDPSIEKNMEAFGVGESCPD